MCFPDLKTSGKVNQLLINATLNVIKIFKELNNQLLV